jgi:DNA-nicking Smr family endonuclease
MAQDRHKDLDLFNQAMGGVTPLKGRRPLPAAKSKAPLKTEQRSLVPIGMTKAPSASSQAFDRDLDRALSRGKRRPEAKLDLHGMTLAAAERAVTRFLAEASASGHRVVLIVTGKGLRLDGGRMLGGRIRAEFPGWLERADNRLLVAGVKSAHLRHGGSGAFYVLLRRKR